MNKFSIICVEIHNIEHCSYPSKNVLHRYTTWSNISLACIYVSWPWGGHFSPQIKVVRDLVFQVPLSLLKVPSKWCDLPLDFGDKSPFFASIRTLPYFLRERRRPSTSQSTWHTFCVDVYTGIKPPHYYPIHNRVGMEILPISRGLFVDPSR